MATGYVPEVQKVAGMGVVEHEVHLADKEAADLELNDKHPNYSSDVSMRRLSDAESNAVDQAAKGAADMEAVAIVWSKKWLIAAYAA
jgi:hypothetical protein